MKGFIIYPTYKTIQDKSYVCLYGRLENGESFLTINHQKPYFYIKDSDLKKARKLETFQIESTSFTNFKKEKLIKIILEIPAEVPKLRKTLEEEDIECYEADIKLAYRFLFDKDIKGSIDITGDYDQDERIDRVYKNPEIKATSFIPELKILSIDIETSPDLNKLYSIALSSKGYSKVLMISGKKVKDVKTFQDEESLLEAFSSEVINHDPDIITGWNFIDFDLKELKKFFDRYKMNFQLGRSNENCRLKLESNFFRSSKADFPGRQVLDALDLIKDPYLKDSPTIRSKKFENYKLDTVANELLGKSKIIDDTKNKGEEITRLFNEDKDALAKYNLEDTKLVYEILEKSELITLLVQRSTLTGMPLDRVNASIASLDSLYIREAIKRKLVVPSSKFSIKERGITGGFVMQSKPGIYDNILVFDFKSLYPSVMMTFNIDPASYKEEKEENTIESPNKAYFENTNGILPSILEKLMKERAKAKKLGNDLASQSIKITMNSMFGSIASPASRFFNMKIANAITHFSQFLIKLTAKKIEEMGYEVIYADTDSNFVNSKIESKEEANKIGKEIESKINSFYKKYVKENYSRESKLELEFEKNYIRFLMPKVRGSEKGAKKRYAGLLEKNGKEIVDITGLEAVRGDWTEAAQKFQIELLDRIFHKKEILTYVKKFADEIKQGKHDSLLVYRKQIRKKLEEYRKITPQHVKAARKLKKFEGNIIEYYLTTDGPEPIQNLVHEIDYKHYINKQLKPIADSILGFFDTNFDDLISGSTQKSLFNY
jgi:DNA polymerase II